MHLIAGIGNPGPDHAGQRHNIGFMAVDGIARRHSFPRFKEKFKGLIADGSIAGERVLLLKPQTYMNLSGESVAAAMGFYKLSPSDVTIIHDEIDLAPGKVKVKTGGGSGGHNGIRSIEAQIGPGFQRVRLGVGHPGHKDLVHAHVLNRFGKSDAVWLDPLLEAIAANADLLVRRDGQNFMNRIAIVTRPEAPPAENENAAPKPAPAPAPERKGPMAEMLSRLFGGKG
jgi:PTH1 family peptidyl-tRNA hydrolase